jgi:hypothetical protein
MDKTAMPETPIKAKPLDCATTQIFVDGPFGGRHYHERLPMPVGAAEGTHTLTIPYGSDFVTALIWNRITVVQTNQVRPSRPPEFVNYVNGTNGQWHYVPYNAR